MKKRFFISSALLLTLFLLTACSSNSQPSRIEFPNNINNLPEKNMKKEEMINRDILSKYSQAEFKTNLGSFTIEFFNDKMPETVANFLNLADQGYFNGIKFHRVIAGFMIQAGDPLTKDDSQEGRWGTGGPGYVIADEHVAGLSNLRGTISMANAGPNSGGSQFFINLVDNTFLDFDKEPSSSKHPVFGQVISGMEVVDNISQVETNFPGILDRPVEAVVIEEIILK
ncbi:MAG: peptidylprolyl isomerase [Patescibacteria group bacterium]|jgi:peptidylprolyl isomerase